MIYLLSLVKIYIKILIMSIYYNISSLSLYHICLISDLACIVSRCSMAWTLLALTTVFHLSHGLEREMTVHIEPRKEDCFYETVAARNSLTVEYQVIDGGSGQMADLDINFRVVNPTGQPVFAEFKKPDGSHTLKSEVRLILM